MKENKVWGETSHIWNGNNTEVNFIDVMAGGYCSKHFHEFKYNLFYVESGELIIEIWKENGIVDKTILRGGESTIVPPKQFHRFTATLDTKALEIYYVNLNEYDIVRETQGGITKED